MSTAESTAPVEYRPIPNFPAYRAGDDGTIWSCWAAAPGRKGAKQIGTEWRLLKPTVVNGYNCVKLAKDRRHYLKRVSCLVLEAFVGPRPPGFHACHFPDSTRSNDRLSNLMWGSPKENNAHKKIHGTHQAGSKNGSSYLNEEKVRRIRQMFATGMYFQRQLGEMFGVTQSCISEIVLRNTWNNC